MGRPFDRAAAIVSTLRWVARIWSLGLFLLWGSFFVEHLVGWYGNPRGGPPAWVTLAMALHLALLVGLVLGWRWELIGGAIVVLAALAFFAMVGVPRSSPYFALTCPPGLLWIVCGLAPREPKGAIPPTPTAE